MLGGVAAARPEAPQGIRQHNDRTIFEIDARKALQERDRQRVGGQDALHRRGQHVLEEGGRRLGKALG